MAFPGKVPLLISILALTGTECFLQTSSGVIQSDLIDSASIIVTNVLSSRFSEVNFVKASKSSDEANDFISGVLSGNRMDYAYTVEELEEIQALRGTKKKNNFIVLDDLAAFWVFHENIHPENYLFSGFYLFALLHGKLEGIEDIFRSFWKKGIYNVNVMFIEDGIVSVVTFLPFSGSKCHNTNPIEVNKFEKGRFENPLEDIFPEKFKNLQHCPLIISTYEDELSVIKVEKSDGSFELSGFDMKLLDELSKLLNFRKVFKIIEEPLPFGTILENGTMTGALGDVIYGRSQMAIGRITVASFRTNVSDAVPYYSFPEVFVISPGRKLTNVEKLMQPFHLSVWIGLLVVLASAVTVIFILHFGSEKLKSLVYGTGVTTPCTNVLIAVLGLSQTTLPSQNFSRFLLMTFLIFCLIIRNAYQGSLYDFLQQDRNRISVNTIKDLIDQDFELYVYPIVEQDYFPNQPNVRLVFKKQTFNGNFDFQFELLNRPLTKSKTTC